MAELKKITIYDYDCDGFKQWIREVILRELYKGSDEESKRNLLNKIRERMLCVANDAVHLSCSESNIECKRIGRGATSVCYENTVGKKSKRIFKEFSPSGFTCEPISTQDISSDNKVEFQWLAESSPEQEEKFLKRFIKFILQEDEIQFARSKSEENKRNLFIAPELKLSSIGFIYQSRSFFGETLKTVFTYHNNDKIKELLEKIDCIKRAAQYVQKICHDNTIYHGDIKPSNFYAIGDIEQGKIENIDLIQNIDFDTWVHSPDKKKGILTDWDMTATTPLYYYSDTGRIKQNQTFETLQAYDVCALSRMFMYAIICMFDKEEDLYRTFENDSPYFDWIDYFYIRSGAGEALLGELKAKIKTQREPCASALFIFERIKSLLLGCTGRVKRSKLVSDVKTFIEKIEEIEKLLNLYVGNHSVDVDTNAIRYLGLQRLDEERPVESLSVQYREFINDEMLSRDKDKILLRNWVAAYIKRNYYSQDEKHYDAIDRHLLPDIQWGEGDDERVEYKFDENDKPVTPPPLAQALEKANGKSLFLTAEGGRGKTTTLRSFWLDFLSGKHNAPCVYVDAKMLNAKNECNAIHQYVADNREGYNLSLKDAKCDLLLLLDGTNESDARLRSKGNAQYCSIVSEIKTLIGQGYKVVVGSRSDFITTIEKNKQEENNGEKEARHEDEFEQEGMQYITACKLRDKQIEHCLKGVFAEVEDKRPMIDLLRNNMMLHIFRQLMADGYNIDSSDMKAGRLLDKYFNQCFKARYFKSVCGLAADEQKICELVEKASGENYNKNSDEERAIHEKSEDYNDVIEYLTNNSPQMTFTAEELADKTVCAILCELSLLKKTDSDRYSWAHELYQEYFQAVYLKECLDRIWEGGAVGKINISAYNAFQFCGEIAPYSDEDYERFVDILSQRHDSDEFKIVTLRRIDGGVARSVVSGRGAILRIAVLSGHKFPVNIDSIGYAFRGCSSLTSVKIGAGVMHIADREFSGCSSLTRIEISDNVKSIGAWAFSSCSSLTSVVIGNSVTSIENCAFHGCSSLTSVVIGNNVTRIGVYAFSDCRSLPHIDIPDNVKSIDDWAFSGCSSLSSVVIGNGVTHIGNGIFKGCNSLTSIEIPDNVKSIGSDVFHGCNSLASVVIGDKIIRIGNSETSIGSGAFLDCNSLTNVLIGNSVTRIGNGAFKGCNSLMSIEIPDNVKSIGSDVFYGCNNLTSVVIGNSVTRIGNGAFKGCNSLMSIEIPDNVKSIDDWVFSGCRSLTSVVIGNNVTHLGNGTFMGCRSLTRIEIPNRVTSIGSDVFYGCSGLKSIKIPNRVTSIGGSAFSDCSSLTSIKIPNSVTSIGDRVFDGCSSLTSIEIPDRVTSIGWWAFSNCISLRSMVFDGTKEQWNAIKKDIGWDEGTGDYVVHCTDGDIAKSSLH